MNNYQQFEQKMKVLGYRVLKGRGISFTDDKKVKIKGSEVGFSFMKIEKILTLKQELPIIESLKQNHPGVSLKQQYENIRKPLSADEKMIPVHNTFNDHEREPTIELQKQIAGLIDQVMKPEHIPEQLAPELLKKLKQKKRWRHHL